MATKKTTTKKAPARKASAKKASTAGATTGKAKAAASATNGKNGKKLSAIDAAAQVLSDSPEPLNCKQLVETMAAKELWTSPGGKTPHATLYTVVTMLPKTC